MIRICILAFFLSVLAAQAVAGYAQQANDDKIRDLLEMKLKTKDLARSQKSLVARLDKIGADADAFDVRLNDDETPYVQEVSGGSNERILILNYADNGTSNDMGGCVGFWIGVRGHRVVASKLSVRTMGNPTWFSPQLHFVQVQGKWIVRSFRS